MTEETETINGPWTAPTTIWRPAPTELELLEAQANYGERGNCDALYDALAAAQLKYPDMPRTATGQTGNRKYSYTPLGTMLKLIRPLLNAEGIAVKFVILSQPGDNRVRCSLHCAGGSCWTDVPIVYEQTMQGISSAVTYARRIGFQSLTGVCSDDEDDDGLAAGTDPAAIGKPAARPKAATEPAARSTSRPAPKEEQRLLSGDPLPEASGVSTDTRSEPAAPAWPSKEEIIGWVRTDEVGLNLEGVLELLPAFGKLVKGIHVGKNLGRDIRADAGLYEQLVVKLNKHLSARLQAGAWQEGEELELIEAELGQMYNESRNGGTP